ncbi:MAG: hypothetical protein RIC07_10340 [Coleofasciculus sp. E1-EBD-02]
MVGATRLHQFTTASTQLTRVALYSMALFITWWVTADMGLDGLFFYEAPPNPPYRWTLPGGLRRIWD